MEVFYRCYTEIVSTEAGLYSSTSAPTAVCESDHPMLVPSDIFVVGRNRDFITDVTMALAGDPNIHVMPISDQLDQVIIPLSRTRLQVIVLDHRNGADREGALRRLNILFKSPKILLVHDALFAEFNQELYSLGCRGVISRSAFGDQLKKAVRAIAVGELWVGRRMLAKMLEQQGDRQEQGITASENNLDSLLTRGEKKIVSYAVKGLTNKEIARALSISDQTVKTHMKHILKKLGVARRQQLILTTGNYRQL
jgi:DNA-binding NarL/FixJ family response regulator